MGGTYYNDNDPYCAEWLRNLIAAGHIAPGDVDERSIADVRPDDLAGYTQCHFFAGIGGWSIALRLAGWPDDRPVWTGSCPCQGFSAAGKGAGFDDSRHLWPEYFRLIRERRPRVVFGEQVASPLALAWLDLVQADMEGAGYAFAAHDLCAAGVGAPHIRQRLWFVADNSVEGREPRRRTGETGDGRDAPRLEPGRLHDAGELAHADGRNAGTEGLQRGGQYGQRAQDASVGERLADALPAGRAEGWTGTGNGSPAGERGAGSMEHTSSERRERREAPAPGHDTDGQASERPGPTNGFWSNPDWLLCRDGKWRPVEPGTFPLAHGVSARVGRLRAYGNAIVPQAAAEFIGAFLDVEAM